MTDYRDPASLTALDVCPHCKTETEIYLISCEGHIVETHRCRKHGDVIPMRSAIHYPLPDHCRKETTPPDDSPGRYQATPGSVWDGEGP